MKKLFFLLSALLFSALPAQAEQLKNIGDLEVHYSSFPSTFLTPEVASTYRIQRSRYSAVVNVTVLDKNQQGKPAVTAVLSGTARNLLGNEKRLSFREIREGKAIYYIAEISHANEESLKFNIDVSQNGTNGSINFKQTFFVD
ncbi:DUF4426 domain-containing protein [Photobacterium swingsii]|uniref:DUF4426 domain-containing protein n=1 Tax=Photobacterium swingsii TaxID=680026 RepID=A0A0J8XSU2_9GAMM|nr:DUF4426 domain-containing protein [Photobacterium swingsii]KMV28439.1 hypothetical protein AB733_23660 [Photobacterium swingsii]PSW21674.1 DUF4426 domain-containing protein [Photobacterium swingsii]